METCAAWNKGQIIVQKAPFKQQDIWAIRTRLEIAKNASELALLNLAIDSKLCGRDSVSLKVYDLKRSGLVMAITSIVHKASYLTASITLPEAEESAGRYNYAKQ